MTTTQELIAQGTKAEAEAAVVAWNSNADLLDEGPATLRFRSGLGWIATMTRWA